MDNTRTILDQLDRLHQKIPVRTRESDYLLREMACKLVAIMKAEKATGESPFAEVHQATLNKCPTCRQGIFYLYADGLPEGEPRGRMRRYVVSGCLCLNRSVEQVTAKHIPRLTKTLQPIRL